MKPPPWKIGVLAAQTGLSLRALPHYDQIGLLVPSQRTPSGHRLYDRADIVRLQQIQSLRLMGLSLDEVRRLLDNEAMSPRHLIDLHLARLHEVITHERRLVRHLRSLAADIDANKVASVEDLCRIIQEMTIMEQFFTRDQLAVLDQRRTHMGDPGHRTPLEGPRGRKDRRRPRDLPSHPHDVRARANPLPPRTRAHGGYVPVHGPSIRCPAGVALTALAARWTAPRQTAA